MKQIQAKTRQFQAKLDLFFILISFGVKITSDIGPLGPHTCDIGPNYLLDKDLIVWGHHKYQSFHVNLTKILLKLGIIVKNRGK